MSEEDSRARLRQEELAQFKHYVTSYVRYLSGVDGFSAHTVKAYEADLRQYCDWVAREGIMPLDVTHRELRRWLAEFSSSHYCVSTIDRHLSSVKGLYRWLVHEGLTDKDCAAALVGPKRDQTLPHTMSAEEVERLVSSCDMATDQGLRDRCFLELLAATGARISEISGLDVPDYDASRRQIRLFGKGSKERIVPVYEMAVALCERYLKEARPRLLAHARRPNCDTAAFFISSRGHRMSAAALRRSFERHVRKAELDPALTPHAMRHTYATELLAGGADMRSVQELLGHADLATTQIYTHVSIDRLKDATRKAHPRAE
jgi:integrase/recombinase XerD